MPGIELEFDDVGMSDEEAGQVLAGEACEADVPESLESIIHQTLATPDKPSPELARGPSRAQPIFIDIETIPDFSREHLFGFDPLPSEIPEDDPAHLLDPEELLSASIDAIKEALQGRNPPQEWIEKCLVCERKGKKRKGVIEHLCGLIAAKGGTQQEILRRQKIMSTTPEMLRIVAIGIAVGDEPPRTFLSHEVTKLSEVDLLRQFWTEVSKNPGPVVGFNVINFDLAAILVRSVLLGVRVSRRFDLTPWKYDVIDLMVRRFGRGKAMPMKQLARLYGINNGAEGVDGSQVLDLWLNDPEGLCQYLASDIMITRELFRRWEGAFC